MILTPDINIQTYLVTLYCLVTARDMCIYTVSQKGSHLTSDNNLGKCGPIFKIFHQRTRKKKVNSLSIYDKDFHLTCNALLHYHANFKNPKMLLIFTRFVAGYSRYLNPVNHKISAAQCNSYQTKVHDITDLKQWLIDVWHCRHQSVSRLGDRLGICWG